MESNKQIQFKNVSGFYKVLGSGEPVLLLHGFCGEGAVWNDLISFLPKQHKLIVPDLPGYGKSVFSPQTTDHSIKGISVEFYAEYIEAILDKEQIEQVTFVGHSMGGYTALAFAEMFPQQIKKLCLFHSHPYEDELEKKENRRRAVQFLEKYGSKLFVEELYNNLFATAFYELQPEKVNSLITMAAQYSKEGLMASCYAMINRKDRSLVMQQLQVPVLLIIGKEDKAIENDKSLNMCALANVTDVAILEGVGHMGMIEAPEQTAQMICNFMHL
jgi:pimeloyl-ACP methyl ester carboxylesterase